MKTKRFSFTTTRGALLAPLAPLLTVAGCMVGPNYKAPATTMPAAYREPTITATTAPAPVTANAPAEIRW